MHPDGKSCCRGQLVGTTLIAIPEFKDSRKTICEDILMAAPLPRVMISPQDGFWGSIIKSVKAHTKIAVTEHSNNAVDLIIGLQNYLFPSDFQSYDLGMEVCALTLEYMADKCQGDLDMGWSAVKWVAPMLGLWKEKDSGEESLRFEIGTRSN